MLYGNMPTHESDFDRVSRPPSRGISIVIYHFTVQRRSELGVDTETNARTDQGHPNPGIPRDQLAFCIPLAQHREQKCE